MRKCSHRVFIAGVLFFCCILLCAGMNAVATAGSSGTTYRQEDDCGECTEKEEPDLFSDWRYVRIYIDETSYRVVDLAVVLGILTLFAVFVVAGED